MAFTYFITLLTVLCLALPAVADDFSDFRIPKHHVLGWSAKLDGEYDSQIHKPLDAREEIWYADGFLTSQIFWLLESERIRTVLRAWQSVEGYTRSEKHRSTSDPGFHSSSDQNRRALAEEWHVTWDGAFYPWSFPLGLTARASSSGDYEQSWSTLQGHYQFNDTFEDTEYWQYDYSVNSALGFGIGRVRDVTGILRTHVVEERLRRAGILSNLSQPTRQHLSDLFYMRSDYGYRHEFSEKYFWRDATDLILADPAMAGRALNPYELYHLAEPDYVAVPYREAGWFIGPALSGYHYNHISRYWEDRTYFESSYTSRSEHDDFLAGVNGEYHRPLGIRWQFDFFSGLMFPVRKDDHYGFTSNTSAQLSWFVADRWSAYVSISHYRSHREQELSYDEPPSRYRSNYWDVDIRPQLEFRLIDRLLLTLTANYSQSGQRTEYDDPDRETTLYTDYDTSIRLGVTYHLIGVVNDFWPFRTFVNDFPYYPY